MRRKPEDFAEFVRRDRGTADFPALTVQLECTYKKHFCGYTDEDGKKHRGLILTQLPAGAVTFDRDLERWLINPRFLSNAIALALKHYPAVYEVEGERITEHHTGQVYEQGSLFGV